MESPTIHPLPPGMRRMLLDLLDAGYSPGCAQRRLSNAPDGAVAWQVQSMLDDYADYSVFGELREAA